MAASLATTARCGAYIAPLTAVLAARQKGSMALAALPFAAQLGNCALWLLFAVARRDHFLWWSNAPGLLLSLFFILSALPLVEPAKRRALEKASLGAAGLALAAAFLSGLCLSPAGAEELLGALAGCGAVAFYAAPLAAAAEVVRTRNAATLSPHLVAAAAANATVWAVYGAAIRAPAVLLPNLFGVATSAAQAALILHYGSRPLTAGLAPDLVPLS